MGKDRKILITGAAGLVGQNLIPRLKRSGFSNITAIDKHQANANKLAELHPDICVITADLSDRDGWSRAFSGIQVLILNHAQIGALEEEPFIRNNIIATQNVLEAARKNNIPYIVHISSSVVNSKIIDFYTETKKKQEKLVIDSGISNCVLRPTLMYGWFDRKHTGWLARFMNKTPVFPIPGNGFYTRQPLYVGDFCNIIISCIKNPKINQQFNISGLEKIYYIDLIRKIRYAIGANTIVVKIPYFVFGFLLRVYALFDRNPPFTTKQLEALVMPETFEVIDWPRLFDVKATPISEGLKETFQHSVYSKIILDF